MFDLISEANIAALIGLIGGITLGLAARIGRFCTLGAIEDSLYGDDTRRLRMWGIAIGVAIIGVHLAMATGAMEGATTRYLDLEWNPIGSIVGGLLFGYGMALCGNCGYGALARLGGGDLRSFVIVLVMGLSAYVVMSGPLAPLRVSLLPEIDGAHTPQSISHYVSTKLGLSMSIIGFIVGCGMIIAAMASRPMLRAPMMMFWGAVVGLAIVSGWIGTHWISETGFGNEPIETHSFAAPLGDTIFYAMTASGNELSFSVGSVLGVIIGAFAGSCFKGHFRWEACEDPRELRRQITGAALMGPGAVIAVGCSVGQGIAAFSLLAFSAPVTLAAIFIGAAFGLHQLILGFAPAE